MRGQLASGAPSTPEKIPPERGHVQRLNWGKRRQTRPQGSADDEAVVHGGKLTLLSVPRRVRRKRFPATRWACRAAAPTRRSPVRRPGPDDDAPRGARAEGWVWGSAGARLHSADRRTLPLGDGPAPRLPTSPWTKHEVPQGTRGPMPMWQSRCGCRRGRRLDAVGLPRARGGWPFRHPRRLPPRPG